jgi:hypothetical protein
MAPPLRYTTRRVTLALLLFAATMLWLTLGGGPAIRATQPLAPREARCDSTSESDTFFDTLEMAAGDVIEAGARWPGRNFGVGKVCREVRVGPGVDRARLSTLISGNGLEIGALHSPFPIDATRARVKYVDSRTLEELRAHYPELAALNLIAPDIVDEAETLRLVADESQDFVIGSHVLEHTDRVIESLANMLRVVRRGGLVVLLVPMRCETFDYLRAVTSLAHLLDEYTRPSAVAENRAEHFREWAVSHSRRHVPTMPIDAFARESAAHKYSIHFHTWDEGSLRDMFTALHEVRGIPPFRILELAHPPGNEAVVLLEKA